jgi:peptidoglycan/LPS O-acetylase OafA/YrhL
LFYYNNYQRALVDPDAGGSWFGHVWSLSLEEQFYVIWPVCLLLLSRSSRLRAHLPTILLAGAGAVLLWREVLIARGASDLRIYFGLDTRADALLVGCALGAFRHNGFRLSARSELDRDAHIPAWVVTAGPIAFVLLVVIALTAPELNHGITWLDRGGYTLVALLAGLVVLSVDASRVSGWSRFLGSRPLAFMGRISYAFYLWHYPVAALLPKFTARYGMLPALAFAFAVSTVLAYLSTRFIEIPAQRRRPAWADVPAVRERTSSEHPAPSLAT